jgi:glutathione synthase/RimK-type ligase-like ATP-grasp enzyme
MPKCTFVTYAGLPDLDPDDRLTLDIIKSRGYECQVAIWDSPDVDWVRAGVVVLRSTWDYNIKYDKFMEWVDQTAKVAYLFNRPEYIRWNSHKGYLRDLAAAGINIVPTNWLDRNSAVDVKTELRNFLDRETSGKLIVKPAIGLATSGVMLVSDDNFAEAVEHVENLNKEFDVMVQPFIASVKDLGEKALVFVNGRYCHAAQKAAFQILAAAGHAGERPTEATVAELDLAETTMSAVSELVRKHANGGKLSDDDMFLPPPLYARVDIVRGDKGEPMVIELELVEPSLFMGFYPLDAELFADAIVHLLKRYERLEQVESR